jgi:hypothetical protein
MRIFLQWQLRTAHVDLAWLCMRAFFFCLAFACADARDYDARMLKKRVTPYCTRFFSMRALICLTFACARYLA